MLKVLLKKVSSISNSADLLFQTLALNINYINKSSNKQLTLFTHDLILLPTLERNSSSSWKKQQLNNSIFLKIKKIDAN